MADDAQTILDNALNWAQRTIWVRQAAAGLMVAGLLAIAGNFVWNLLPRHYVLSLTGGEIVGNRHQFARILQDQAHQFGIDFVIKPTYGSIEAMNDVAAGRLDMALVLIGGYDTAPEGVVHVATVAPELIHALVKADINSVKDLRGKVVNLGPTTSAQRAIGQAVLRFSGLEPGIDFFETGLDSEQLIETRPDHLPDMVFDIALLPSFLSEFLVRERGYKLMELPFPASLALRMGWVAQGTIGAYTYSIDPPVPPSDLTTIGVGMHLLANKNIDSRAVFRVLEALFSPAVASLSRLTLDESKLTDTAGFPIAQGAVDYIGRNDPLISTRTLDKIKNWFGLVMSVASTILVVLKWFKGPPPKAEAPPTDDPFYQDRLRDVALIDAESQQAAADGKLVAEDITGFRDRLGAVRRAVVEHYPSANLANPGLVTVLLMSLDSTMRHLQALESDLKKT